MRYFAFVCSISFIFPVFADEKDVSVGPNICLKVASVFEDTVNTGPAGKTKYNAPHPGAEPLGTITEEKLLGKGATAEASIAKRTQDGVSEYCILKKPTNDKEFLRNRDLLLQEYRILKELGEPVKLIGYGTELRLMMPVFHNGKSPNVPAIDLNMAMKGEGEFKFLRDLNDPKRLERLREIEVALSNELRRAADKGVVHGDIKPANILIRMVKGRIEVKLIDWNGSRLEGYSLLNRSAKQREHLSEMERAKLDRDRPVVEYAGTPAYMGQEALQGKVFTAERDVHMAIDVVRGLYLLPLYSRFGKPPAALEMDPYSAAKREVGKNQFEVVGRAYDKEPLLMPPSLALAYSGHLPRTLEKYEMLTAAAAKAEKSGKASDFIDPYAKLWTEEYRLASLLARSKASDDPIDSSRPYGADRKNLLIYSLFQSTTVGPKAFEKISNPAMKEEVYETLRLWKHWCKNPDIIPARSRAVKALGFHKDMGEILAEFEKSPEVQAYLKKKR